MDPILVISITDDSSLPLAGEVISFIDEETVTVAWGDERYKDCPSGTEEYVDDLTPWRQ